LNLQNDGETAQKRRIIKQEAKIQEKKRKRNKGKKKEKKKKNPLDPYAMKILVSHFIKPLFDSKTS